jgi:hypothetical protein
MSTPTAVHLVARTASTSQSAGPADEHAARIKK